MPGRPAAQPPPRHDLAASARLLEASFRQTLSKCIKTDGRPWGSHFLGVDWKGAGAATCFPMR